MPRLRATPPSEVRIHAAPTMMMTVKVLMMGYTAPEIELASVFNDVICLLRARSSSCQHHHVNGLLRATSHVPALLIMYVN